jgi:Protein of unknown function (DUF3987)
VRKKIIRGKGNRAAIKLELDALGPAPEEPRTPMLTCADPTYEGLCKVLETGQPSIGVFTSEGGQFIAGHGMAEQDAKLRTAAGLSKLWDGGTSDRVRAHDGVIILPGRRVGMHLLAQPDIVATWTGDPLLIEQGLMSRTLLSMPEPASGRRLWHEPSAASFQILEGYSSRLLELLEMNWRLARCDFPIKRARFGLNFTTTWKHDLAQAVSLRPFVASAINCRNTRLASRRSLP